MTQQRKVFAANSGHVSFNPRTHRWKERTVSLQAVL